MKVIEDLAMVLQIMWCGIDWGGGGGNMAANDVMKLHSRRLECTKMALGRPRDVDAL